MDAPDGGEILSCGLRLDKAAKKQSETYRRNSCGFVFQEYNLIPELTAGENVELALRLCGEKQTTGADGRGAGARRSGRICGAQSHRTFGRTEAARGDRAGGGEKSRTHPRGRADGGAGRRNGGGDLFVAEIAVRQLSGRDGHARSGERGKVRRSGDRTQRRGRSRRTAAAGMRRTSGKKLKKRKAENCP